ncbi:hypothetical protein M0805_004571 [Coniferiporia weirii]|nr:hypothetical protein M0805_004571 [Coniferiporia weirii]
MPWPQTRVTKSIIRCLRPLNLKKGNASTGAPRLPSLHRLSLHAYASSSIVALQPSSDPPSVSLLFSVLFGLPLALWTYKCLAMVLFQRKIIYMGYVPPGARTETLQEHGLKVKDMTCEETQIPSKNRVKLSALIMSKKSTANPDCVVIYLQGNAGNPLHRIPVFTELLASCKSLSPIVLAAAPRSYWRSTRRRPTQQGILADYQHVLRFAAKRWPDVPLVLYGHSLGGAIAVCLLASLNGKSSPASDSALTPAADSETTIDYSLIRKGKNITGPDLDESVNPAQSIRGLILENPFSSIPDMVRALYPQRWLPYRFLAPLAWDKWNALGIMQAAGPRRSTQDVIPENERSDGLHPDEAATRHGVEAVSALPGVAREMLVLVSARDEVVPREMGRALYDARPPGGSARFVVIDDALHEDAWRQKQWAKEVARYLERVSSSKD